MDWTVKTTFTKATVLHETVGPLHWHSGDADAASSGKKQCLQQKKVESNSVDRIFFFKLVTVLRSFASALGAKHILVKR